MKVGAWIWRVGGAPARYEEVIWFKGVICLKFSSGFESKKSSHTVSEEGKRLIWTRLRGNCPGDRFG